MLTQEEAARLRIKARHGELSPEEQLMYSEYMESQVETYNTSPNVQAQPVQSAQVVPQPTAQDNGSFGWAVLGFFIPIAGLILYLVWRTEKPLSARRAGIGALVSGIGALVLVIVEVVVLAYTPMPILY